MWYQKFCIICDLCRFYERGKVGAYPERRIWEGGNFHVFFPHNNTLAFVKKMSMFFFSVQVDISVRFLCFINFYTLVVIFYQKFFFFFAFHVCDKDLERSIVLMKVAGCKLGGKF